MYVVDGYDWFDVGYAIGDLILQRCQLEDAFSIRCSARAITGERVSSGPHPAGR